MKSNFFPFSGTVYLPNSDFLVIGGLNNVIQDKPAFSDQTICVKEVVVSPLENFYTTSEYPHMIRARGCFACIYTFGQVFVFGGTNYDNGKQFL